MEDELIRRAQHGDDMAFDALIDQHREAMFRYAYLVVRDAHSAEDVTQEAILRIYRSLHRLDDTRPFRPWALHITRNLARNQLRALGRYKNKLLQFFSRRDESSDVETLTHAQQQAKDLHMAVSRLKTDYQDVIYARFFMGLSVEESAVALGIAEGTVKSRSHRALAQLKGLIETQYPQIMEAFFA